MKKSTIVLIFVSISLVLFASIIVSCSEKRTEKNQKESTILFGFGEEIDVDLSGILELVPDTSENFGIQTGEVSAESPIFEHNGVSLNIDKSLIEDKISVKIEKLRPQGQIDGLNLQVYDFSIEDYQGDFGQLELRIPYITDGLDMSKHSVGAGFFNPSKKEWEPVPFEVDDATRHVIIKTNHLSVYSSFVIKDAFKPNAMITGLKSFSSLGVNQSLYEKVLIEMIDNNMQPGPSAVELGLGVVSEWFSFAGASMNTIANVYDSQLLDKLNSLFTNLGGAMAILNVGISLNNSDKLSAVSTALRERLTYTVGTWGTRALQLGFVGVFLIDYSLNSMFREAIGEREAMWNEAYRMYYKSRENYRTRPEWMNAIKDLLARATSVKEFHDMLENEINNYIYEFWQDETAMAFYFSEAKKVVFTGGGGLNEEMKQKISLRFKYDLISMHLTRVFDAINIEIQYNNERLVREKFWEAQREMNKKVQFEIKEEVAAGSKPKYAGYSFRFAPLSSQVPPDAWRSKLNKDSGFSGSFTVLGHLMSGLPKAVEFFKPGSDSPDVVVPFKVMLPKTIIKIAPPGQTESLDPDLEIKGFSNTSVSGGSQSGGCITTIEVERLYDKGENLTVRVVAKNEKGWWDLPKQAPPYKVSFDGKNKVIIEIQAPICTDPKLPSKIPSSGYVPNATFVSELEVSSGGNTTLITLTTNSKAAFKASYNPNNGYIRVFVTSNTPKPNDFW